MALVLAPCAGSSWSAGGRHAHEAAVLVAVDPRVKDTVMQLGRAAEAQFVFNLPGCKPNHRQWCTLQHANTQAKAGAWTCRLCHPPANTSAGQRWLWLYMDEHYPDLQYCGESVPFRSECGRKLSNAALREGRLEPDAWAQHANSASWIKADAWLLPPVNLIVMYDGRGHFKGMRGMSEGDMKARDALYNKRALQAGMRVLRIHYLDAPGTAGSSNAAGVRTLAEAITLAKADAAASWVMFSPAFQQPIMHKPTA